MEGPQCPGKQTGITGVVSLCKNDREHWSVSFILIITKNSHVIVFVFFFVSEIEICQQGNQTIQHQLHIKSPNFPYAWSSHIKCQCDIEGDNIVIATRTLILTGHSSNSVLEISYNENGSQTLWPQDGMHTMFDQQNRKLVIAKMASKIKVSVNTPTEGSSENMFSLFMFDFQGIIFITLPYFFFYKTLNQLTS